jgi:hypothetical protein
MKRLAQLLNVFALFALVALAGPRLEQAAFEAELLGREVAEQRDSRAADQTPPCLAPAEPAGPEGARKESGERELGGADGDVEQRVEPLPPDALATPLSERPARVAGIRQPHLRVNGSADAFGARC